MRPHCSVFDVVSLPARKRSRQHKTRFPSSKPSWLLFWQTKYRNKSTAISQMYYFWVLRQNTLIGSNIPSSLSGRHLCNLVGCLSPDPTCASLFLPWLMLLMILSCWRCGCEALEGVASALGMNHTAVRKEHGIRSVCSAQNVAPVDVCPDITAWLYYKYMLVYVVHLCLNILPEPIWSPPGRPSQSDCSACSGRWDRCSRSVSRTLSGRWCWPQRCLTAALGQMALL